MNSGWMQDLYAIGEHLPFGRNNGFREAASLLEWIGSNWRRKGLGIQTFIPITSSGEFREHSRGRLQTYPPGRVVGLRVPAPWVGPTTLMGSHGSGLKYL